MALPTATGCHSVLSLDSRAPLPLPFLDHLTLHCLESESGVSPLPSLIFYSQAASPDEIALAEWSTSMGMALIERSNASIKLKTEFGKILSFTVLQIFPFSSESKRMGIILRVSLRPCYICIYFYPLPKPHTYSYVDLIDEARVEFFLPSMTELNSRQSSCTSYEGP